MGAHAALKKKAATGMGGNKMAQKRKLGEGTSREATKKPKVVVEQQAIKGKKKVGNFHIFNIKNFLNFHIFDN